MPMPILLFATADPLEWQLQWSWLLPTWASLLLMLGVVVWIAMLYAKESAPISNTLRACLALLRIVALGIVLVMIAQPTLNWFRQVRPSIVVLVDRSASMAIDDVQVADEFLSRLKWSQRQTATWLEHLQQDHRTQIVTFAADAELTGPTALQDIKIANEEDGTHLGEAIDFALSQATSQTPAAVVLLSDGMNTSSGSLSDAVSKALRLRVPVFSAAVGSDRPQPDLAIENVVADDILFPGDFLQIEVTLTALSLEGQRATVILEDRSTASELAKTDVPISSEAMQQIVRLGCRVNAPGVLQLQLRAATEIEEKNTANNVLQHTVNISDDKIHVLLIDSSPSYEYRSLASLLSRDPAVSLRTWLQEADPDFAEVDRAALRALPSTEAELLDFDVIILGDVDPGPLPASFWASLESVVSDRGRGLVVIAGHRFMPHVYRGNRNLQALLPIDLQKQVLTLPEIDPLSTFQLVPTAAGRNLGMLQLTDTALDSQAAWEQLPPITWLSSVAEKKPGAHVLVEARNGMQAADEAEPIILRHYAGAGEVLYHATDETYRWKWQNDDRIFARYWGQVVRRLGRSRVASQHDGILLTSDRQRYRLGESVRLKAHFYNSSLAPAEADGVAVELVGVTQPRREIRLTRQLGYRGEFGQTLLALPADRYTARIIAPLSDETPNTATFEIEAPPGELARTTADFEALNQLSAATGGKAYTTETADELTIDLPPPQNVRVEVMKDEPLWNSHWVIVLLLIVLTSEWILRRRSAML